MYFWKKDNQNGKNSTMAKTKSWSVSFQNKKLQYKLQNYIQHQKPNKKKLLLKTISNKGITKKKNKVIKHNKL